MGLTGVDLAGLPGPLVARADAASSGDSKAWRVRQENGSAALVVVSAAGVSWHMQRVSGEIDWDQLSHLARSEPCGLRFIRRNVGTAAAVVFESGPARRAFEIAVTEKAAVKVTPATASSRALPESSQIQTPFAAARATRARESLGWFLVGGVTFVVLGALLVILNWPTGTYDDVETRTMVLLVAGWILISVGQLMLWVSVIGWSVMLGIRASRE